MVLTGAEIAALAGRGAGGPVYKAAGALAAAMIACSPKKALGVRHSRFGAGAIRERPSGA